MGNQQNYIDKHSRMADELLVETESDEHIIYCTDAIPIYAPEISKIFCLESAAYTEALEFIHCDAIFPTVEEALIAFRKKYKIAYDEKMELPPEEKEQFLKSFSCKHYITCIDVANNLLDVLNASK